MRILISVFTKSPWLPLIRQAGTRRGCACLSAAKAEEPTQVRVRYAPSPTGQLHLGGLRTALYNWLLAKRHGGKMILRIEDTDQSRLVEGSAEKLEDILVWAGVDFDESPSKGGPFGPYVQSKRLPIYKAHADRLLEQGHAYRCYCTAEELEQRRGGPKGGDGLRQVYDRRCMHLPEPTRQKFEAEGRPFTLRMKVPEGQTKVHDLVFGTMTFDNKIVDDQILLKSDGFPTYHLACVVDDHWMKITHVLRGEEWLNSAPKHVMLYDMFGWKAPQFAHLPLLLRPDRKKLSKRQQDAYVEYYVQKGYLPQALCNFVAYLGWTPTHTDREIWTLPELADLFSLDRVHTSGGIVDETKLKWINKQHMQRVCSENTGSTLTSEMRLCVDTLRSLVATSYPDCVPEYTTDNYLKSVITLLKDRISWAGEAAAMAPYLWTEPNYASADAKKWASSVWDADCAIQLQTSLQQISPDQFTPDSVSAVLDSVATASNKQKPKLMQLLRLCLTASKVGAGVPQTAQLLGRQRSLQRMQAAITAYS
eukprot:comp5593_c0_seq1/m.1499 comp5593_c0_seq1/g.1499  ORF comp5593_c0_seq1/g.1499 comp5593_c0_seq1/m.1499 type:complete len:535 (-) comp5593_c0_seq1:137-1741(-)